MKRLINLFLIILLATAFSCNTDESPIAPTNYELTINAELITQYPVAKHVYNVRCERPGHEIIQITAFTESQKEVLAQDWEHVSVDDAGRNYYMIYWYDVDDLPRKFFGK